MAVTLASIEAAELLAAEYVTVFPRHGHGRIHSTVNHSISGKPIRGAVFRPTSASLIRSGCYNMAPCCVSAEGRLTALYRRIERKNGGDR